MRTTPAPRPHRFFTAINARIQFCPLDLRRTPRREIGYHSGKRPDVVVMGKQYDGMIGGLKVREPEAYEYAVRLLSGYETAFEGGAYRVLVRRGERPCQ